jgi:hypothetical protein
VDGPDQLAGLGLLEHVGAGPRSEGLENVGLVRVHGEDDDPGAGFPAAELPDDVEPPDAGHHQVEHEHVRPDPGDEGGHLGAVAGLPDDLEVRLGLEHRPKPLADDQMVVGQSQPDGHVGAPRAVGGQLNPVSAPPGAGS